MVAPSERASNMRHRYQRKNNLIPLKGVLGKKDGTISTASGLGTVWVQIYSDQGLLERIALPPTIPFALTPGLPVTFKYNLKGRLEVDRLDTEALASVGVQPAALSDRQASRSTIQADFETLRCVAQTTPSLTVAVRAWVAVADGTVHLFPGATQDLTSFLPSAGQMRYAALFVKSDYSSTLEVVASTARTTSDLPLGEADIQECVNGASVGSTGVWAVKLTGGQSQITQGDIDADGRDLRQMVNVAPTYTQEFRIPSIGVAKGASAPTDALRAIGASGTLKVPVIQFSKTTQQDVYFEIHAPQDLDNNKNVAFHVMVFPGAAWTTGDFMMKLEYLVKDEDTGATNTGAPTTIQHDYTPVAATEIIEQVFVDTINLDRNQTAMCHFYRDVANDNGDDVLEVRFFEINYTSLY